jgi:SNF2 family DNA or RNA helicase
VEQPPLWEHQKETIRRGLQNNFFGIYHDVGVGKTRSVIEICRARYTQHSKLLKTLIVSPLITLENWRREWGKYAPKIPANKIMVLSGSGARKAEKVRHHKDYQCVFIVNYDALLNEDLLEAIKEWGPEVLICDESQRLKNPTAKRTKALIKLSKIAHYRYIMSGTPLLKSPLDLYSQFLIMDRGETFGDSFFRFRLRYFVDKNAHMPKQRHFPNWVFHEEKRAGFNKAVDRHTMSVRKQDCLSLPPFVRQEVFVDLGPEQKKAYNELKKHFIAFLNGEACSAPLAITKALRLQQVVTGHLPMDDGNVVVFEENPRAKALEELLEDLHEEHKIIVWCGFKEDYRISRDTCERLGIKYVELHGGIPQKVRQESVDLFNAANDTRVLIANPRAVGIGINLVSSDISIYYSRTFSLEDSLQSEARNYRSGSEIHEKITRIDIIAQGTIDEDIIEALRNKKEVGLQTFKFFASKDSACNKE